MRFMVIPRPGKSPESAIKSYLELVQECAKRTPPPEVKVKFSNGTVQHVRLNEAYSSPNNIVELIEHQDKLELVTFTND